MAYSSQDFNNGKTKTVPNYGSVQGRFVDLDRATAAGCTGYSDPGGWVNDKTSGSLTPAVLDRMRQIAAALANGGAHYVAAGPFKNDKTWGHLGPDLLSKLNALEAEIALNRP